MQETKISKLSRLSQARSLIYSFYLENEKVKSIE